VMEQHSDMIACWVLHGMLLLEYSVTRPLRLCNAECLLPVCDTVKTAPWLVPPDTLVLLVRVAVKVASWLFALK
jgi:hypothetical protein